jgi:23S rRNA (pseudouridine1915-N3)-methyltransferase
MKISLIVIGKIKEDYLKKGILEYSKRISKYSNISIIEIKDESLSENMNESLEKKVKEIEGNKIIKKLDKHSYKILLDLKGDKFDSVKFAKHINNQLIQGKSNIIFIVGGSIGVSDEVVKVADLKLSFSDMTFPHQLMRLILLEQIYRAFKILNNETYHK